MKKNFDVIFLEEAITFLDGLEDKARSKIIYNIRKAQVQKDKELLKKLDDEIWEFRTLFAKTYYRLFAFWDKSENKLIIITHGLIKKTSKTPKTELKRAKHLRSVYIEYKNKRNK